MVPDEARAQTPLIEVELVWSVAPGGVAHTLLNLPEGSTVAQALLASPDFGRDRMKLMELGPLCVGVWGRVQTLDAPLRHRDRIEVYRPLTVDPKEARRLRYRAKGERIVSRHRPLAGKRAKAD